jgi:tetratricopeptide (TPR) repeat protein
MNDRPPRNVRPATASQDAAAASKRGAAGLLVALLLLGPALSLELGCRRSSSGTAGPRNPETERAQRRELLHYAIGGGVLQYEQYDSTEMLQRAVSRLDQWARDQEPLPDWKPDPMLDTLPEPLARLAAMLELEKLEFPKSDALVLREAAWFRDVAGWARGDAVDELDRARRLFDWTVRNVQLEWGPPAQGSEGSGRLLQKPWETLLFGRATATDRAWVFLLLARQQKIDAALVALVDADDPTGERVHPWAVAVLCRGELYLFDPTLGIPIPGPDGVTRGPAGPLDLRPATLAEVAADDGLLRRLDVDAESPYPVKASQVQKVVVLLEASPACLSQRMKLLEAQLVGEEKLVLTTDASAQAERFRACRHVVDVRLWPMPYQVLVQEMQLGPDRARWQQAQLVPFMIAVGRLPALWKGRQYHLKGVFTGEENAVAYYQMARPPDSQLQSEKLDPNVRQALTLAKMDASYWLGLIVAEQGNYPAAIDWFAARTLKLDPEGGQAPGSADTPWAAGATYNLARAYEADGQIAKAIQTYRSDAGSPYRDGNLLRARWLESQTSPESAPPSAPETAGTGAKDASQKSPEQQPETAETRREDTSQKSPEQQPESP